MSSECEQFEMSEAEKEERAADHASGYYGEFETFRSEECFDDLRNNETVTKRIHNAMMTGEKELAGAILQRWYIDWCTAKGWEDVL